MAIDNKRYSHFNAHKHETTRQNIGWGHSLSCLPTKLLEDMPPSLPRFGAYMLHISYS